MRTSCDLCSSCAQASLIFTAVLLLTSCKQNNNPSSQDKDDIVLAQLQGSKLYQQDAFDALGTGLIDADTALFLSGYIPILAQG